MVADENQQVFVRIERNLAQIWLDVLAPLMDFAEGIHRRSRFLEFHLQLFRRVGFLIAKLRRHCRETACAASRIASTLSRPMLGSST